MNRSTASHTAPLLGAHPVAAPDRRRVHRRTAVVGLLLVAALATACGDDSTATPTAAAPATTQATAQGMSQTTTVPATPAASGASAATGTSAVVVMDRVAFLTTDLKVARGTEVEFRNDDTQAHTATSDRGAAPTAFDTDLLPAGRSARVRFDQPGTYAYHCSLHPFMTARITVA